MIDRLRQSLQRFLSLFRRARLDQEHDAEVVAHLDLAIDENRKNGMSAEEARRQALIHLGGVAQTKENYRDHRGVAWLETLFRDLRFAQWPPRPEIYLPSTLADAPTSGIMVSTTGNPQAILPQIRSEISAVDPHVAIGEAGTIATRLEHYYYARPRFLLITLCTFAAIALLLVAAGVFSVISYTVAAQTHEIGIRMALGAQAAQVLGLVVTKGTWLILAGTAIGLFASHFLTRLLSSQIWGVSATDPSTFAAVAFLALFVGILACLIPARRATRVDPMVALRYE
jgi:hypothetical protein